VPLVLVVPLELPVQNLRDLIAFAKARPGAVNFASAGLGSTSHSRARSSSVRPTLIFNTYPTVVRKA
jgi:tripartite-type tricarboxylate transporter receptor subunit TctC